MPCFFMHAAPALPLPFLGSYSPHFSNQQPACYSWPGAPVLTDALPSLLFSLGTSALWGPRLMCDDVYCLLICPLSGYQGPEWDSSCGEAIKGGQFRMILWFVRTIPHKTKRVTLFCPLPFRDMCGLKLYAVWGWWKIGILVNILRIWNVCVGAPCAYF